jgi:hypothetical protein
VCPASVLQSDRRRNASARVEHCDLVEFIVGIICMN